MKNIINKNSLKTIRSNLILLSLISLLCANTFVIQAQVCATRPAGLVSWYRAENNALDFTSTHDGTLQNGAGFSAGKVGQGFGFDGSDDYVDLGNWNVGTQWTLEAWVNVSSLRTDRRGIFGGFSEFKDWGIGYDGGQFVGRIRPVSGGTDLVSSGIMPAVNTWYHVVVTSDGTTAKIYVDGIERGSVSVETNYTPTMNGIRIGNESCCGANFHGLVDEATVYNRALSTAEIAAIYNAGSAGKCAVPTAAAVRVSGRVLSENGRRGIGMTLVTLTDAAGETRTALTNPFGYFRFEDVPTGQTYIISANSKRYVFSNQIQVVNVTEELNDINFTAVSPSDLRYKF